MFVAMEWGPVGAEVLAETCDVLVVVDVLVFTTTVTVAAERGAEVWPHPGGAAASRLAEDVGAVLAADRWSRDGLTLSPASLRRLEPGTRLVLPSPNGSSIAFSAAGAGKPVIAGCLRNASAVAAYVREADRVGVVPAGERWPDGSLRPAYEDLVGAGAVIDALHGADAALELSPEAEVAALGYRALRPLEGCPSGRELVERGFADDVRLASQLEASDVVPRLVDGRFAAAG